MFKLLFLKMKCHITRQSVKCSAGGQLIGCQVQHRQSITTCGWSLIVVFCQSLVLRDSLIKIRVLVRVTPLTHDR